MKDDLGDRMKLYESSESDRRFIPMLPICIRLDGKCFSSFTRDMVRPFDSKFSDIMIETTKFLIKETNACIGYTQSDEISLILYSDCIKSQVYFDGRIQKIVSVLASKATSKFVTLIHSLLPNKAKEIPSFDCRAWNVPNKDEAVNTILWRELDATKNSISSLARAYFSHKQLDGKTSDEKQEMLFSTYKINWNDLEVRFKRGSYLQRKNEIRKLTANEIALLPLNHEAIKDSSLTFERSVIKLIELPPLVKIINRVDVIFNGVDPIVS